MRGASISRVIPRKSQASQIEFKRALLDNFQRIPEYVGVGAQFFGRWKMEMPFSLLGLRSSSKGQRANGLQDIEHWPLAWIGVSDLRQPACRPQNQSLALADLESSRWV
jgi:hypothetical protein